MKTRSIFILLLICSVHFHSKAQVQVSDSLALVDLYLSTDGANWDDYSGWLTAAPVDQWYGVTVSGGRVDQLYLYDNKLNGSLPESIGDLDAIRSVNLAVNQLFGELPESIGDMAALQELLIYVNEFSGTFPSTMANMTQLHTFEAYRNQFQGFFPPVLLSMNWVIHLDISSNLFGGPLPSALETMTQYEFLDVSRNQFTGPMFSIAGYDALGEAHFSFNLLTGDLSDILGYMPSLYYLTLSGNQFTGCLDGTSFNPMRLSWLDAYDNDIDCLGDFSGFPAGALQRLSLYGNALTFDDLEPNAAVSQMIYSPQDPLLSPIDTLLQEGSSYTIHAGSGGSFTQYQWYHNDILIPGADGATYEIVSFDATAEGVYHSIMTNALLPQLELIRRPVRLTLDIQNQTKHSDRPLWSVYPNPAENLLWISFPEYSGSVQVINLPGRALLKQDMQEEMVLDISQLLPGTYFLWFPSAGYYEIFNKMK